MRFPHVLVLVTAIHPSRFGAQFKLDIFGQVGPRLGVSCRRDFGLSALSRDSPEKGGEVDRWVDGTGNWYWNRGGWEGSSAHGKRV